MGVLMLSYGWMGALALWFVSHGAAAVDALPPQAEAVVAAALARANERALAGDRSDLIEAELAARLSVVGGEPGPDYVAPAWDVYARSASGGDKAIGVATTPTSPDGAWDVYAPGNRDNLSKAAATPTPHDETGVSGVRDATSQHDGTRYPSASPKRSEER